MRIGLIQSRGIGDVLIALPIAKHFVDSGCEVLWPIDADFAPSFIKAAPYVEFIPLQRGAGWCYETPLDLLRGRGCERIIPLYHHLAGHPEIIMPELAATLKFDQYKYAVAEVPFRKKWNLQIVRDHEREDALLRQVAPAGEFVVCHLNGNGVRASFDVAPFAQGRCVVEITARTDSIFDWLTVIERASLRVMIDSCYSNLTEQLEIAGAKMFITRSPMSTTPVLLGDWQFVRPNPILIRSHDNAAPTATVRPSRIVAPIDPPHEAARNAPCRCGSGLRYQHCHGSYLHGGGTALPPLTPPSSPGSRSAS
jgi:hypothetical protein